MDKIHFPAARHPELKDLLLADLVVGRVRETDKEWARVRPEVRCSEGSDSGRFV